jgi:hypothetical protein
MSHEAYKRFVDEMVTVARRSVTADRVRANGHPVRTNERDLPLSKVEAALKGLFNRLSSDERELLALALEEERQSAVHGFASFLEWATAADEMTITWRGETFANSPFAAMHHDFISRLNGDEWENT